MTAGFRFFYAFCREMVSLYRFEILEWTAIVVCVGACAWLAVGKLWRARVR